jgi:dolichol-phosphate mannosyltransferase
MSEVSPRTMRVLCMAPAWNEGERIAHVVRSIAREHVDEVVVVDDGSSDDTAAQAAAAGATVLRHERNRGVGAAIRTAIDYGRTQAFDVLVVVAGGGKTPTERVPALLEPIAQGRAHFVQGSRYLRGGAMRGAPWHRRIGTLGYTGLFVLLCRRPVSDASSGYRAMRLSIFDDPEINLWQPWLDGYELEPYLLFRVRRKRLPYAEVPVTIAYPPRGQSYTKMRGIVDWWRIFRPLLFLATKLRS